LRYAVERTRRRVSKQVWEVYRLTALDGKAGEEVASELGVSLDVVYKSKSRFLERLKEELSELESRGQYVPSQ
jgi:RNA polymerase sigma-70 factor (ECF subfamily)